MFTADVWSATPGWFFCGISGTTSPLVSTYESKDNSKSVAKFTYTYDKAGNITRQTASNGTYWAYDYDVLGEMRFATSYNANGVATARYKYYYDAAGNIKSREITNHDNSKVLESHTYTYGDANWKDLLTAFDGKTITYDQTGNPTSYYDGSTLVWKEGRRLQSITKDGKTASYLYNADGQRTKKTYPDGSYTKFCVVDGRVVGEIIYKKTANGVKWSHGMRYIYGDDGSVIGFGLWDANTTNEWERYYFVKNLQGDVLKVYRDADNVTVASYTYDPFGNILTKSGEMADENPFRYRGYYYDTETGFYYLQSRYYDPQTCRFINADSYASTGQGFVGYNMFTYCNNNPVNKKDQTGHLGITALLVTAVVAVCTVALSGCSAKSNAEQLPYKTADDAARAFSEQIYSSSLYIRHEYSTIIYSRTVNGETTYNYNPPHAGTPHTAPLDVSTPEGTTSVAYAHTHPNSNSFSGQAPSAKSGDIPVANSLGIDAYVVGPRLELRRYSVASGVITNLGVISPIALTDAQRSSLVSEFQVSWDAHISAGCEFGCGSVTWPTQ